MKIDQKLIKNGIQFECQGSGKCCTSHGEYGFVFLSIKDIRRFAKFFKLSSTDFKKKYCQQTKGLWHLKEDPKNPDCMFLTKKRCDVYEARPTQCRTWPFWPETLQAKTWKKDVVSFCPGIGKGSIIPTSKILKMAKEQQDCDDSLL